MKTVTSRDNPVLKKARKLLTRKGRAEASAFLAEGRKLISEAKNAGYQTECVFINAGAFIRGEAVAGAFENECLLEENLFNSLSQTQTPQPYIAIVTRDDNVSKEAGDPGAPERILVLDRISDPGNVGTMIRTALASDISEVWCVKETADVFSDKAIRASAGAVFYMTVREGLSAADCISRARGMGAKIIVCDAGGTNLYDNILTGRLVIVIGNESDGPESEFMNAADSVAGIPMSAEAESLNAATAAAIIMYEALRQREAAMKGE